MTVDEHADEDGDADDAGLSIGDRVVDRDQPESQRSPARVVDIPGETAEEFVIEGVGETVDDIDIDRL